jgi:hypothetical protein
MRQEKHFVTFSSPGTFVAEETTKEIASWDVEVAKEMAHGIVERYGATPFGFQFFTEAREAADWEPKEVARSSFYHLGGRVETLAEVETRNDPEEETLRWNMKHNGIQRIIVNDNSWRSTRPLREGDVVLDFTPRKKEPVK